MNEWTTRDLQYYLDNVISIFSFAMLSFGLIGVIYLMYYSKAFLLFRIVGIVLTSIMLSLNIYVLHKFLDFKAKLNVYTRAKDLGILKAEELSVLRELTLDDDKSKHVDYEKRNIFRTKVLNTLLFISLAVIALVFYSLSRFNISITSIYSGSVILSLTLLVYQGVLLFSIFISFKNNARKMKLRREIIKEGDV